MHSRRQLVEERIARELAERVGPLVHPSVAPLAIEAGPTLEELTPFAPGSKWGAPWGTTWFRLDGTVPEEWRDRDVVAIVDLGFRGAMPGFQCEGLVRQADGTPVIGVHPRRTEVPVDAGPGEPVTITIEAASNPMLPMFRPSPLGRLSTAPSQPLFRFGRADLVVVDRDAEALRCDLEVLDGVMRTLPPRDRRRARLLATLERALDIVGRLGAAGVAEARQVLAVALGSGTAPSSHRVVAAGHAHIDTAWLWPIRETKRKCVRTFTSAVAMMDRDPSFVFVCSQAQQYEWVRQAEPALFERIKAHVAGGQWVPIGGMWVESDMNLPSGESIARQIVAGQRYFEAHFGRRCTEMWIPDVFGYPAGLPQVFAAGGMSRFVTQKLSWNRTNVFPHHTFWWEGLDGTRVLTHFPPVDTYNAEGTPAELAHAVDRFAEHAWSDWSLVPFGHGDGGGGPTPAMLERLRRMADLDGMPRVEVGPPSRFFANVEAEVAAGAPVPVWRGELYFETHRGTLTSQLRTKLGNRRCERLLRTAELLAATAAARGVDVDPDELVPLWQEVLTQQFHDVLPGSSIGWVHDDAEAVLARVAVELEGRVATWVSTLAAGRAQLVNPATNPRLEVVVAEAEPGGDGPVQRLDDGRTAFVAAVPGLGLAPVVASPLPVPLPAAGFEPVVVGDRTMANGRLAVAWDEQGHLASVVDVLRGREVVPGGRPAAVLELAVDHPVQYDAWDLEEWTVEQGEPVLAVDRIEVEAAGPLVGIVTVHRRFGPSSAVVRYVLRAGSPRLDVEIDLDWLHVEHLLSMVFPLDLHTDVATCGVQFGAVRRPTHASTSWDAAKFEVCAHRWVDVAEPGFGVAVLDDGRFGHGLFGGGVRVSLARAARYPDPDADQGRHRVTLALFPHGPGLADVVAEAERLDLPLQLVGGGVGGGGAGIGDAVPPVVQVRGVGVEVDAVKVADDGSGDLVVRLHQATGDRVGVAVAAVRPVAAASRTNLLEEPEGPCEVVDGTVALTLRPFELVTLRLTLGPPP